MKVDSINKFLVGVLFLTLSFALAAQTSVTTVEDLWNVRNNLTGTYQQSGDINLETTNPSKINAWDTGTLYVVGNIIKYTDGFAYYCKQNMSDNTGSQDPGTAAYWTKMWEAAKGWEPIGRTSGTGSFRGVYDGNNKIIYNLYINRGASAVADNVYPTDGEDNNGLFGYVENTSTYNVFIKNLGLINPNVTGRRATGSLVGRVLLPLTTPARSYTVYIERCYAIQQGEGTATVTGFGATGGLVGANNSNAKQRVPVIRLSYARVTVSATHPTNYTPNPNDRVGNTSVYNPYNIKYGGLVGCNENGVTQDSFARGNVSGGDRVGGLAGCTIGGAIFRSYSTGTVTRNIEPGGSLPNYEGGIGGLVGRTSGSLPPGLGGTNATGSCENCFWDTETSRIATSPGGTGKTTTQMKTQSTFTNWDFTNIWNITSGINDGYPFFIGSPVVEFYYRSKASGDWNNKDKWQYTSTPATETSWVDAVVTPDESNSISIQIRVNHTMTVTQDVRIDATIIDAGGRVTVASGKTLYVDNGVGPDLTVNGVLEVTGTLVAGINTTIPFGIGSELIYNGSAAQTTGDHLYSSIDTNYEPPIKTLQVSRLTLNNSAGLTFTNPIEILEIFQVLGGSYALESGVQIDTDGVYSPTVKYFKFDDTGYNILNYSAEVSQPDLYPDFVDRQWSITGNINDASSANRTKQITFYWTSVDDQDFDWAGLSVAPAVYAGITKLTTVSYDVSSSPRSITVDYTFPNSKGGSKETFKIGRDDDQTLPVQLSSFTAMITAQMKVRLNWVTQTETNVAGFSIYRGTTDELGNAEQLNVFIPATNTSQTQYYMFTDDELYNSGTYFYWLESRDFDGSGDLFGPVTVVLEVTEDNTPGIQIVRGLDKIYPNPFNPSTTIKFGVTNDSPTRIQIYNMRGQLVRDLMDRQLKAGNYSVVWDGKDNLQRNLPSGNYYLRMQSGKDVFNGKLTLMK